MNSGERFLYDAEQNGKDWKVGDEVTLKVPYIHSVESDLLLLRAGAKGKIVRKQKALTRVGAEPLYYIVYAVFPEERYPTFYDYFQWLVRDHPVLQKNVEEGQGWRFVRGYIKRLERETTNG